MPPKFKGEVPLTLEDGRRFTLVFNNDTLFAAEAAYGQPLHILLAHLSREMWGAVRAFLFAGLQPKHPGVSIEDCGEMLLKGGIAEIGKAIIEGLDDALPDATEGKEGTNPPSPRRGKASGRNGAKSGSTRKPSGKQRRERTS